MHIPSRLFVAFVTGVTEAAWVAAAFQPLGLHHRHGTPFSDINSQAPAHARSSAVLTSTCARGNCRRRAILALKLSAKECGAEERAEDKDPPPNLDPRFYHLFDRSQSKVDQLEHADAMAKTGFELDGAVLINKAGQRIHPEALRGTSVGMYLCVAVATVLQRRVMRAGASGFFICMSEERDRGRGIWLAVLCKLHIYAKRAHTHTLYQSKYV